MKVVNFVFPKRWEDLDDRRLKYVFKLLSKSFDADTVKIFCLFRWNGVSVLARNGKGDYMLSKRGEKDKVIRVSSLQIAEILPYLSWLDNVPENPVRVARMGFHKALPEDFREVPFEKFIMADNLYQGYLQFLNLEGPESPQADELISRLGYVLYGKSCLKPWQKVNCFYWMASLKNLFSRQFPDFFQPASSGENTSFTHNPLDSMNAMIRALTKGDITKEKEILRFNTWRALTELNAQAKEYKELNQKLNKK